MDENQMPGLSRAFGFSLKRQHIKRRRYVLLL
jgi:hypothetical protein